MNASIKSMYCLPTSHVNVPRAALYVNWPQISNIRCNYAVYQPQAAALLK